MKKFLLLLTLFCTLFSFSTVNATEVTIGDLTASGTAANTNIPFSSTYNYGFSQQIYTAAEIAEAGGGAGTINSLTLWMYNTSTITSFPITIHMAEVSDDGFASTSSWCTLTASNLVYSGTLTNLPTTSATVGAVEFTLSSPFTYSGTGNLLVAFANNTGSWNSGLNTMAFSDETTDPYRALYKNQDAAAIDPTNPSSVTGTQLKKRNVIKLDMTLSGPVIVCDKPETLEANDVAAHTATISWTGGSGTYNVQYKGAGDDDWTLSAVNITSTSYALQNLKSNTAYQVQVQSVCGDNTSGWKSVSFSTLIDLPYLETFDASTIPAGWNRYTGTLNADGSADLTASTLYWVFGNYNGVFDSHTKIEVYSTRSAWLVTPAIPMKANQQLSFNMALTHWTGSNVPAPQNPQPDARFVVLASTDGGNNWVTLREWNNAGSPYVFDNIICSAEGEEVTIDLSAYGAGQTLQIAFYVYHNTGGDNNLHIDNVAIENIPTCFPPQDLAEVPGRTTKNSMQLFWTAVSGETAWVMQYKKDTAKVWSAAQAVAENPYTLSGLSEFTAYNIRVAAVCDPLAGDTSKYCKAITVKTASGLPFHEGFSGTLPSEWKRYKGNWEEVQSGAKLELVTAGWDTKAANGVFPDSAKHLVFTLSGATCKDWLVSPLISMEAGQQLTFNLALTKTTGTTTTTPTAVTPGAQPNQQFIVGMSQDGGASWDEIGKWDNSNSKFDQINATADGQLIKIVLNDSLAGKNVLFAFYAESTNANEPSNNLHISDVKIAEVPACENSTSLDITDIQGVTATATWDNEEGAVWQYYYKANAAANFVPKDSNFIDTIARTVTLTGLTENTTYTFYLRKKCGLTYSEIMSREFTTIQTPATLPYSHDFESGNGWYLINGDRPNKWVVDEATNNTPNGSHALYISNDNGASNKYTVGSSNYCMVYATKTFYFDEVGMYLFQYDWKAWGYSTSDYLRVALVPADLELTAGTTVPSGFSSSALPTGWKALDGGSKLNLDSAQWNTEKEELAIEQVGYYKMVFAWRNSSSSGKNPPAAVDNISVARIKCTKPENLAASEITESGALITWDAAQDGSWEYALDTAMRKDAPVPTEFTPLTVNTIQLSDLAEKTSYKFYLRKVCGGEDGVSDLINITFKTLPRPIQIPWSENFNKLASGIPEFWDNSEGTTTTATYKWNRYVSNGDTCLRFNSYSNSSGNTNMLALPRVALTENALLSFRWKNPTGGAGEVLISNDGGANRESLKNNLTGISSWTSFEIDLSAYTGDTVIIYFKGTSNYGNGDAYLYLDDVAIEALPACMKPSDIAAIDSLTTTTSATIYWTAGYNEKYWLVQYKKSADSIWTYVADSVKADTLVLSGLEPANVYDVRVAAWCNPSDSTAISEYSSAISVATLCEPWSIATKGAYTEGFEDYVGTSYGSAGVVPVCWDAVATGSVAPHVIGGTSTSYKYIHDGEQALTFYGSGYCYAALPEFADPLNSLQISFWMQTESASYGTLSLGYITADDQNTFHEIVSYENSYGSMGYRETKLDTLPASAARLVYCWYYSSQWSCCIDDIKVEFIPNCLKPDSVAAIDGLATPSSVVLTWKPQGAETAWALQYKESTDSIWSSIVADNDTFLLGGLKASTYYDVKVAAICSASDTSEYSVPVKVATGCAAISQFPYSENFDGMTGVTSGASSVLPLCWNYINTSTYSSYKGYPIVYNGTSYAKSGNNSLKFYSYGYSSYDPQDQYAILPEMEGISALRMKFNARKYSASYDATVVVGVMSNPDSIATFVAIDTISPAAALYEPFSVLFNEYTGAGKYIAIKMEKAASSSYRGIHIDDIVIDSIPSCLEPKDLEVELTRGNGSVATLKWAAGAASSWVVEYSQKANFSDSIQVAVQNATANLTGLQADSTYYARVKAICGADDESEWSAAISFVPTYAIIVNDSTATNSYVPVYGMYVDDGVQSQFIVPESELGVITWDSITQLTFYSSTATAAWTDAVFEVYMAQTSETTLSAMADWTKMDKVMNAKHLSIANKQMVVTLDEPYQYQGGNLLIGIKQTVEGTYVSSTWYGKVGVSGNSMYQYGTNAATKSTFKPKMKIDHVHGEAPTCIKVSNLKVSGRTASSAVIGWTNGDTIQNAWQIAYSTVADFNPAEVTPLDVQSNPYTLSELLTDTTYYVYVRANCGEGDFSQWSKVVSFRTAKACQLPDEVAVSASSSSATISWYGYGQTGFNLRYTKDGTNWIDSANVVSPFILNGLEANTTYRVKVQAACDTTTWTAATVFKTAYEMPYEEAFGALTAFPSEWERYSGILIDDVLEGKATLSSPVTSGWNFISSTTGVFASKHMYVNIWSTYKYWTVLPTISIEGNAQLTFDMVLSKSSSAYNANIDTTGVDDKFAILASEDNGATWKVLRQWDNDSSEYVYNRISATGEEVAINLSEYAGKNVKIAFYGGSKTSNADNYLHIDNVLIDKVPTCLKPKNVRVPLIRAHRAQIQWTAVDPTQDAWQIAYDTIATNKPDTLPGIVNATDTSYILTDLVPAKTYYVYVRANCGAEDGMSRWTEATTFRTTIKCPAPTDLKAKLTPGNGSIATLTWKAGGDELSWVVEYSRKANLSDSIAVVVDDSVLNLTGLQADSTYYARVKADCGDLDGKSTYTSILSFTPTNRYELLVNDGTNTNAYVPINGQWAANLTRSQFIIPETALESIEWDSILNLTFYASQASVNWGAAEFKVYMAEAPDSILSAPVDWTTLTQVVDSATLSVSGKQMVVTLDAPYQYQGGNLLIGFYQTVNGTGKTVSWYGKNTTGASFGGYGEGNNFAQRNFLPKVLIEYKPGVEPPCTKARHLKVAKLTDYEAVLKWDAYEGATWQYALIQGDTLPAEADYVDYTADTIAFSGLNDETEYVFYLRKACGVDGTSPVVSKAFKTNVHVEEIPFEDNFEGVSVWKLINGNSTNAWTIGTAAGEGNALYISNDGGTTNAYTFNAQTAVYATLLIDIKEAAMYAFSYNWKANGEYSDEDEEAYDYFRVALAPDTVTLIAGERAYVGLNDSTLPAGWLPLDGGKALVESTQWKRNSFAYDLTPGQYKVVLTWINDEQDGNNMPAAIDNFRIIQNDCHQPTALMAKNITPVSATLSWSDGDDTPNAWQIALSTDETLIPDSIGALDVMSNPYELANLNEETTYYVAVRVNCGEGDFSPWSTIHSFTTLPHCDVLSQDEVQDTICMGESYTWHGKEYTKAGIYYDTLPNASVSRCDSIVTLVLSYYAPEDTIFVADTINEVDLPYIYQADYIEGQARIQYGTTTAPGTYKDTAFVHGVHCAAPLVLTLTIEPRPCQDVTMPAEEVSICQGDSYMWRDKSYSVSGLYYDTVPTIAGCDSIFVLRLSYYAPEDTIFVAETIRVNELPYTYEADYIEGQDTISYAAGTAPGTYSETALVHGTHCTAVLVHTLTIKEACQTVVAEPEVVINCNGEAYTWHRAIYSVSGIYYDTLQTVEGCDSVAVLDLTIAPAQDTIVIEQETICPGETYIWNDQEYAEAGLYVDTLQSIYGCDSIAKLELSIYAAEDSIFAADTISESDLPYTYEADYIAGQAAISFAIGTKPGVYTETALVNGKNCAAVLSLTMTIEKAQGINDINGGDGKKVQKLIYHDVMYIIIDNEWYSTSGQKVADPRE